MGRSPWWLPWAVYVPLAVVGGTLAWWLHGRVLSAPPAPRFFEDARLAQLSGVVLALVVTLATVSSTRWLVTHARWARALHGTLRAALLGATPQRIVVLSLSSAVAEELFFRAALMPQVGVVASSLLFGALHVSSRDTYLGWMLWASLMGAVFAGLYLGSGTLLAPIVAHAAINHENMRYVCSFDPTSLDRRRKTLQSTRAP